jgi:hypothetical protein
VRVANLLLVLFALIALIAAPAPLHAKGGGKKKDDEKKKDPKKELLVAIGKSVKSSDASAIGKHFRTSGKIDLKLKGVKNGQYRSKQALGVLKDWFKAITPTECKLSDKSPSTYGKYKLKYKKSGKTVEATLKVYLEKEDKTWRIKGIEET